MSITPIDPESIQEGVIDLLDDIFGIRESGYLATQEVGRPYSPDVGGLIPTPPPHGSDPDTPASGPNPEANSGNPKCAGLTFPLEICIPVCIPVTITVSYTIEHCIVIGNTEHCSPVTITSTITAVSCKDVCLTYDSCQEFVDKTHTGGAVGGGLINAGTDVDVDYGTPTSTPSDIGAHPEYDGWDSGEVVDGAIEEIPEIWETGSDIVNQLGTMSPSAGKGSQGRGSQPQLQLRTDYPASAAPYLQDMLGFDIGAGWGYVPPSGFPLLLNLLRDYLSAGAEARLLELIAKRQGAWIEIQRVPARGQADSGYIIEY